MKERSFFSRVFGKQPQNQAEERILAPVSGEVIPIENVNDATFAQKILGDGLAIIPEEGKLYAPACGVVQGLQVRTGHALCIEGDSGIQLLVHIGRDTVKMEGRGFTICVKEGQRVAAGDLLIEFDLAAIKAEGYDDITPVVILNWEDYDLTKAQTGPIRHGDTLFTLRKKGEA